MTIEFIWRLPSAGDVRYADATRRQRGERGTNTSTAWPALVSDPRGDAFNYFDYLHQVARAAQLAGFDGLQIPNDPAGDEPWIVAGVVAPETRRLKLLTEFDASRGSAVYAAKNGASFQRYTGGRFAWQITPEHNASRRRRGGDFADDADLLPRIEEFVTVARGVLRQSPFTFKGRFFEVLEGGFQGPLGNQALPPVFLGGQSEAELTLSSRIADVHLFDAQPAGRLKLLVERLKELSSAAGREVGAALRIDLLARDSEEEAVFDARRYREQSGASEVREGTADDPVLWVGLSTRETGAAATLVGSYAQVSAHLHAFIDAGITSFILAGLPHLEEAYRIGEHVLAPVRASAADRRAA